MNISEIANMTEITARAKAFSQQGVQSHSFAVGADGCVRVWDPIAGYYTTCHSLTQGAQARIQRLAAAKRIADACPRPATPEEDAWIEAEANKARKDGTLAALFGDK